jgi:PAS domain S-box-containing protein
VLHLDAQHRVLAWNASAGRMFGYSADEAAGRDIIEMIVPNDRVGEFREMFRALLEGRAGHVFSDEASRATGA